MSRSLPPQSIIDRFRWQSSLTIWQKTCNISEIVQYAVESYHSCSARATRKVRALCYVNALHVFLGFSFPCVWNWIFSNQIHQWCLKTFITAYKQLRVIIIIIIITTTMFMVLSSWHSHCESSPGSFDECRLSAGRQPSDQTNRFGLWVRRKSIIQFTTASYTYILTFKMRLHHRT